MRRYKGINKSEIFEAWNRLRNALLAARDGNEVEEIMNALFTSEEKLQLGRRIIIAEFIKSEMSLLEISQILRAGNDTISRVVRKLEKYPRAFELIEKRGSKVESEYDKKKYRSVGGSKLVYKKREYAGITRRDIKR